MGLFSRQAGCRPGLPDAYGLAAAGRAASGREDAFALGADAVALLGAGPTRPLALTRETLQKRLALRAGEESSKRQVAS